MLSQLHASLEVFERLVDTMRALAAAGGPPSPANPASARSAGVVSEWSADCARMHARERDDFGKTYAIFHRVRVAARPEQLARCEALLGRPATRYAAYVADCAAQWTAADRGPAGRAP